MIGFLKNVNFGFRTEAISGLLTRYLIVSEK